MEVLVDVLRVVHVHKRHATWVVYGTSHLVVHHTQSWREPHLLLHLLVQVIHQELLPVVVVRLLHVNHLAVQLWWYHVKVLDHIRWLSPVLWVQVDVRLVITAELL